MLVLKVKPQETVTMKVGGIVIEVMVVDCYPGAAKIGVSAPDEVVVARSDAKRKTA